MTFDIGQAVFHDDKLAVVIDILPSGVVIYCESSAYLIDPSLLEPARYRLFHAHVRGCPDCDPIDEPCVCGLHLLSI